jgi:hypothetical protein
MRDERSLGRKYLRYSVCVLGVAAAFAAVFTAFILVAVEGRYFYAIANFTFAAILCYLSLAHFSVDSDGRRFRRDDLIILLAIVMLAMISFGNFVCTGFHLKFCSV